MVSPRMVGDLWYSKRRHYFCGADGTSVGRPPRHCERPARLNHRRHCARIPRIQDLRIQHLRIQHS
jgi:hypothetical protein